MKEAFLIISDLHLTSKEKTNRKFYVKEVNDNLVKILQTGNKYVNDGYKVSLIFLGDIADRSYSEVIPSIQLNNMFVVYNMVFEKCYTVLGNHEFSFYTDNPTWTLFANIKSDRVNTCLNSNWKPLGMLNLVEVVDTLEVGDTVFSFMHHPTGILTPVQGKVNIGLFHKDLVPSSVVRDMEVNKGLEIWSDNLIDFENTSMLDGYNYCFFGHVHKMYGKFRYVNDKTNWSSILYYLGSLGRPNQTEVQDNFLERNIPAVIIEDGKFNRIEDNLFNLRSREESVIEQIVVENKEAYEKRKEQKELLNYEPISDNPIDNINNAIASSSELYKLFNDYLDNNYSDLENNLNKKLEVLKCKIGKIGL